MKTKYLLLVAAFSALNFACQHKIASPGPASAAAQVPEHPKACVDSVCRIRIEGYPQEVAVLIPPYADYKNVTLFLHGFIFGKERDKNLDAIMKDFDIVKAFKESKSNRILIIPFSSGQNKDYRQFFKNKLDVQMFLANVYKVFGMKTYVEDMQIIAHSGAYLTTQKLIEDPSTEIKSFRISQVTLLDATYSEFNPRVFNRWLKSGDYKMTVIYLRNSPTEKKALELWSLFSGQKPGKVGGFNLENADDLTLIPESEVRNLPDAHWLLVRKWFGRVL